MPAAFRMVVSRMDGLADLAFGVYGAKFPTLGIGSGPIAVPPTIGKASGVYASGEYFKYAAFALLFAAVAFLILEEPGAALKAEILAGPDH